MEAPPAPRVTHPVMYHRWSNITFIHWRYPSTLLQSMLPPGLTVQTLDRSAWVGLTPFRMERVRPPLLPALPWLSRFPEINVRTYVQDSYGRSGIWFLSLDAARLPAVLAARAGYRLPYFWSDMTVHVGAGRIRYRCRRRCAPSRARCDADVEAGPALPEAECDALVHFLTARYRLFTVVGGRIAAAEAEHQPWPLHRASLLHLEQNLLQCAGLPPPSGAPLVHASPGVTVRIGLWHPLFKRNERGAGFSRGERNLV